MSKIVIGFGSGRCGTQTLAAIIAKQPIALSSHEASPLKWNYDVKEFYRALINLSMLPAVNKFPDDVLYTETIDMLDSEDWIKGEIEGNLKQMFRFFPDKIVCDVAWCWVNYIESILRLFPDAKAVCLKRGMKDTVDSWCRITEGTNFWTERSSRFWAGEKTSSNKPYYPKYDLPKKEALERYWMTYYAQAEILSMRYPDNVRIFGVHLLNNADLQREMLEFIGVDDPVIKTDIHLNKSVSRPISGFEGVKIVPFDFNIKHMEENKGHEFTII